jgi:hypothetical protein
VRDVVSEYIYKIPNTCVFVSTLFVVRNAHNVFKLVR